MIVREGEPRQLGSVTNNGEKWRKKRGEVRTKKKERERRERAKEGIRSGDEKGCQ